MPKDKVTRYYQSLEQAGPLDGRGTLGGPVTVTRRFDPALKRDADYDRVRAEWQAELAKRQASE